jgi:hypothetical protein
VAGHRPRVHVDRCAPRSGAGGADTDRLDLAPQCAGLLAIPLGLADILADDQDLLAQGLVLYDALYAWCRQPAPERHVWSGPS